MLTKIEAKQFRQALAIYRKLDNACDADCGGFRYHLYNCATYTNAYESLYKVSGSYKFARDCAHKLVLTISPFYAI